MAKVVIVVPTWNYTAVHAHGSVQLIHEKNAVLKIVRDRVAVYDQRQLSFESLPVGVRPCHVADQYPVRPDLAFE